MYVNGLAWVALKELGWRWLVGLSAIPVALAMFSFPWLPESPHWLMTVGREEEAKLILQRAAILNGRLEALPRNMKVPPTPRLAGCRHAPCSQCPPGRLTPLRHLFFRPALAMVCP